MNYRKFKTIFFIIVIVFVCLNICFYINVAKSVDITILIFIMFFILILLSIQSTNKLYIKTPDKYKFSRSKYNKEHILTMNVDYLTKEKIDSIMLWSMEFRIIRFRIIYPLILLSVIALFMDEIVGTNKTLFILNILKPLILLIISIRYIKQSLNDFSILKKDESFCDNKDIMNFLLSNYTRKLLQLTFVNYAFYFIIGAICE